jgi:hypothetical protein
MNLREVVQAAGQAAELPPLASRESAWSIADRPATSRKSLGVKTPPRPRARARFMIRSGTEVAWAFMRQKIGYLFLTSK